MSVCPVRILPLSVFVNVVVTGIDAGTAPVWPISPARRSWTTVPRRSVGTRILNGPNSPLTSFTMVMTLAPPMASELGPWRKKEWPQPTFKVAAGEGGRPDAGERHVAGRQLRGQRLARLEGGRIDRRRRRGGRSTGRVDVEGEAVLVDDRLQPLRSMIRQSRDAERYGQPLDRCRNRAHRDPGCFSHCDPGPMRHRDRAR